MNTFTINILATTVILSLILAYQPQPPISNLKSQILNSGNGDYQLLENSSSFKKALQTKNDTTNTIISDFVQEKKLEVLSEKIITKGKFYFKKPQKLRWEYTEPFDYIIIINDGKVMIDDEGSKSEFDMENNKLFRQINDLLVNLVRGQIFDSDDYQAQFMQNSDSYKVKLKPVDKKLKEYINKIHIVFNKETLAVQQVKMTEKSGDYTLINFENKRLNGEVPDGLFEM